MYVPDVDCEIIYKYFQLFLFPGTLDHRCISRKHLIIKYVKKKNVDSFRLLYFFSFLICVHRVSVYTGYSFDNIKKKNFKYRFTFLFFTNTYICRYQNDHSVEIKAYGRTFILDHSRYGEEVK